MTSSLRARLDRVETQVGNLASQGTGLNPFEGRKSLSVLSCEDLRSFIAILESPFYPDALSERQSVDLARIVHKMGMVK